MSDAPRWPGADGSTGLDFSRSDKPAEPAPAPEADAPSSAASEETRQIPKTDSAPPSERPEFGFNDGSAKPRSQSADDWQLDSITRAKPSPLEASIEDITAPSRAVEASSVATPSRAAAGAPAAAPAAAAPSRAARRTRKARLRLHRIDPWSVMKTSFLFSIAFFVMLVAGIAVLWSVFAGSDTMTYINDFVNRIMADDQGGARFDIANYLGWERVIGLSAVLGAINVVIFTAVATLFAFLYNLSAVIMGGLEVTLAED